MNDRETDLISSIVDFVVEWFLIYFNIPLQAKLRAEEEDRRAKQVFFPREVILERMTQQQ